MYLFPPLCLPERKRERKSSDKVTWVIVKRFKCNLTTNSVKLYMQVLVSVPEMSAMFLWSPQRPKSVNIIEKSISLQNVTRHYWLSYTLVYKMVTSWLISTSNTIKILLHINESEIIIQNVINNNIQIHGHLSTNKVW